MTLKAELLEDAHLGSGAGGGGIDALFARDRDGKPVIWASHLEGVMRDAARRLDGEADANAFFGAGGGARQAALFTSLYVVSDPDATSDMHGRIWRSSARAAFDNRAPDDNTLRAVEHIPKRTCFEGSVELPARDLPRLRRLLMEVDALGRGRASGAGRVRLCAIDAPSIPPRAVGEATGRLLLSLRNLDPLCITATATPDNILPSLAFAPGRAIIGALANWLLVEGSAAATAAAERLVSGEVSVSDALPAPAGWKTTSLAEAEITPAPLLLRRRKPSDAAGSVPWWAMDPVPPQRVANSDPRLPRSEDDLFLYRVHPAKAWRPFRPTMRVRLRNGRSDPTKSEPSLFAVEQIAERTDFLCDIRGAPECLNEIATALAQVLKGRRWLRLGRGGVAVEVTGLVWAQDPSPRSGAFLTLTSDLLVRDEYLRWLTSLDSKAFCWVANWPADATASPKVQDGVSVHGFNGTSRLWRMPAAAIRRGSVFEVTGPGVAVLADMVAKGAWLGERTHEGFGRFRLDDVLPGSAGTAEDPDERDQKPDDPDESGVRAESIASTTYGWMEEYQSSKTDLNAAMRQPSPSQWRGLLSELESDVTDALSSRLKPTTVGKMAWKHARANAILVKLDGLKADLERKSHARFFVRWLETRMRGSGS
jgi:hypothetical protein